MANLFADILGLSADVASIVGLLVSIVVALAVRRLRAFYVFKGRAPELTERIAEKASRISTLNADFPNTRDQIRIEMTQVRVLVESLASKSAGASRAAAKRLATRIRRSRFDIRADVTDVYADIQAVLTHYEELQRDVEWER